MGRGGWEEEGGRDREGEWGKDLATRVRPIQTEIALQSYYNYKKEKSFNRTEYYTAIYYTPYGILLRRIRNTTRLHFLYYELCRILYCIILRYKLYGILYCNITKTVTSIKLYRTLYWNIVRYKLYGILFITQTVPSIKLYRTLYWNILRYKLYGIVYWNTKQHKAYIPRANSGHPPSSQPAPSAGLCGGHRPLRLPVQNNYLDGKKRRKKRREKK